MTATDFIREADERPRRREIFAAVELASFHRVVTAQFFATSRAQHHAITAVRTMLGAVRMNRASLRSFFFDPGVNPDRCANETTGGLGRDHGGISVGDQCLPRACIDRIAE